MQGRLALAVRKPAGLRVEALTGPKAYLHITSHNADKLLIHKGFQRSAAHRRRRRASRVNSQQFREARVFSGLDRHEAAEFLGVSLRTVGHWETGHSRPTYAAFKLLRVYRHGDLIHPAWSAYKINHRGFLCTPEGHEIGAGEMTWLSLLVRRAEAFSQLLAERDRARGGEPDGKADSRPRPDAGVRSVRRRLASYAKRRLSSGHGAYLPAIRRADFSHKPEQPTPTRMGGRRTGKRLNRAYRHSPRLTGESAGLGRSAGRPEGGRRG